MESLEKFSDHLISNISFKLYHTGKIKKIPAENIIKPAGTMKTMG